MTDTLLFVISIALLFFGNKTFNLAMKTKKDTDPPSNFSDIENPQMLFVSFVLFFIGCWVFYEFFKTQM